MKPIIHAAAGVIGLLCILTFWLSTAFSETLGSDAAVATVKGLILWGMLVLVPSMMIVGASGTALGEGRRDPMTARKKTRMVAIAANGLIILVPSAFFLEARAAAGAFDAWFYGIQALELLAGATNITLMSLNLRDGLKMTGRLGRRKRQPA